MTDKPKPDLSEHEEDFVPFDDVLRTLLKAKPSHGKPSEKGSTPKKDREAKDGDEQP